jgi:hypothetical protein
VYWKSSELLVVMDSEQYNGWQQLHDSYSNGHPDHNAMGFIEPKRIQIKLLKPDLALVLTWWSVTFPSSKRTVVENTTMNLQKFGDGWKIVVSRCPLWRSSIDRRLQLNRRILQLKRRPFDPMGGFG